MSLLQCVFMALKGNSSCWMGKKLIQGLDVSKLRLFLAHFLFFFPGHTLGTWQFPVQGSNPRHSSHDSRSLTCCTDNTGSWVPDSYVGVLPLQRGDTLPGRHVAMLSAPSCPIPSLPAGDPPGPLPRAAKPLAPTARWRQVTCL